MDDDAPSPPPRPSGVVRESRRLVMWLVGVPFAAFVLFVVVALLVEKVPRIHRVQSGAFQSITTVERFGAKAGEQACASLPAGAREIIPLGARPVDHGSSRTGACRDSCRQQAYHNGTRMSSRSVCTQVCERVYVPNIVDTEYCTFVYDAWNSVGREAQTVHGFAPAPPAATTASSDKPGAERRRHSVKFEFRIRNLLGDEKICVFWDNPDRWAELEEGSFYTDVTTATPNEPICTFVARACAEAEPSVLCDGPVED